MEPMTTTIFSTDLNSKLPTTNNSEPKMIPTSAEDQLEEESYQRNFLILRVGLASYFDIYFSSFTADCCEECSHHHLDGSCNGLWCSFSAQLETL